MCVKPPLREQPTRKCQGVGVLLSRTRGPLSGRLLTDCGLALAQDVAMQDLPYHPEKWYTAALAVCILREAPLSVGRGFGQLPLRRTGVSRI